MKSASGDVHGGGDVNSGDGASGDAHGGGSHGSGDASDGATTRPSMSTSRTTATRPPSSKKKSLTTIHQ